MATIGTLAVEISASTDGFTRSMRETTTAMDRFAQSGVDVELGLDSDRALRDVERLKKQVGESSLAMQGEAIEMPTLNLDSFEEVADILIDSAEAFETKMMKAIDLMIAKLKTATIGNSRGANLFVALLKGSAQYVVNLGAAKVAWESVYNAELRAGKTAEEAQRSADINQAAAVAASTSGITKVIKGMTAIKDRAVAAFAPLRNFNGASLSAGIGEMAAKFGKVGEIAGKMFSPIVDVGGKAINFIGNNIGKIVGVMVVGGATVYASWKAISGLLSIIQGIASVVSSIFSAFGSVIAGIGDLFGSVIDIVGSLAESLGAVIGAVYEIGAAVVAQIYAPFDYAFGKIGDLWGSVYDTIMGGFSSIKSYILGALTAATMLWLGKIAWDSGIFGQGLAGLNAMFSGGAQNVGRKDASGEIIDEGGVLQKVAEKASGSIKRFFDTVQKMFGVFFASSGDIISVVAEKVSIAIDWITANMQSFIASAIDVALYITTVLDSTVGFFRALFQGDWSGAGAMALDVGAKITDGLATIISLIAPTLDWIANKVTVVTGVLLEQLGNGFSLIEQQVRQTLGFVAKVMTQIADMVLTVGRYFEQLFQMGKEAYWRMTNPVKATLESVTGSNATKRAVEAGSMFSGADEAIGKLKIFANKTISTSGSGAFSKATMELGKDIQKMGTDGLGLSNILTDGLARLAESARGKRDELDPNAVANYGGTLDPLKNMLEDLKKSLGLGKVIEGQGKLLENDKNAQDLANGGGNTLAVDTALGTVKLAGSFDKTAMLAKNALTEAQRQTMILQQTQKILQDSGVRGERFVQIQVGDEAVSMNRLLTKMETRQDLADPTKKITQIVPLVGQELVDRIKQIQMIAENQLGGSKDLESIDFKSLSELSPTFLADEVKRGASISDVAKTQFAEGGDPEQRKLTSETNTILKKIANSKTSSPFT